MWYIKMDHVRTFFSMWHHDCQNVSNASKNWSEFVLIIFYLQLTISGHADSSMSDKMGGKLSS